MAVSPTLVPTSRSASTVVSQTPTPTPPTPGVSARPGARGPSQVDAAGERARGPPDGVVTTPC
eukprot:7996674-Pyramimonas_sp.AAC.1